MHLHSIKCINSENVSKNIKYPSRTCGDWLDECLSQICASGVRHLGKFTFPTKKRRTIPQNIIRTRALKTPLYSGFRRRDAHTNDLATTV